MTARLTSTSSFAVWGVYAVGPEWEDCLLVCTSKHLAERKVRNLQRQQEEAKAGGPAKPIDNLTGFVIQQTTLLVHDGCHHLNQKMRGKV